MKPKFRHLRSLAIASSALLSISYAQAATFTWTKAVTTAGATDNWSTGTNWLASAPVSAADTTLVFGYSWTTNSTGQTNTLTNDVASPFSLNVLTLGINTPTAGNGSQVGLINIAGSPLNFVSNGATTPQVNLSQNRSTGQVVSFDVQSNLVLTNNTLFTGNGTANFTVSGAISGSGTFTKSGTSTLTLSNASNSYNGGTTLSAGILSVGVAAILGDAASVLAFDGGTLQITGTAINSFLGAGNIGRTVTFNSGKTVGLDINNALNTFTADQVLNQGTGGLAKAGAGTLELSQVNTFTGNTTISAGTLKITGSGSLGSGTYAGLILNSGTLTYSSSASQTLSGVISGAGALNKDTNTSTLTLSGANTFSGTTTVTAGTLTLTNARALQNSALVTTTGTSILSGITGGLTVGGLSGSRDLGSADVLSGYTDNVNALTLNTVAAGPFTYSGIISNGTGAMTLTKTGTGTQILSGDNSYTGATIVKSGTLTVGSGAAGSLSSSSALQMGGNGIFNYSRTGAGQTVNGLTVNGGGSAVNNNTSGQTLTLGAITRTASQFGTVNFTRTGNVSTTTGNAASTGIIGPWATTGSGTSLRYAIGSADNVTATDITPLTGTTATAADLSNLVAGGNFEYSAAATTVGNLSANTLRYHTGAATATVIGAANTLTLNGLMNAGAGTLTISGGPSTGGIIIGSTNELVITANTQATIISAVIADGAAPGALVYAGGGILSLNGQNIFTGGIYLNNSTIQVPNPGVGAGGYYGLNNNNIYASGNSVINNANTTKDASTEIYSGGITLSDGAVLDFRNNTRNFITSGAVTGNGGITLGQAGQGATNLSFNSTGNNFTGPIRYAVTAQSGNLTVNSLADATSLGAGDITFGSAGTVPHNFTYGASAIAPRTLDNRRFELTGSGTTQTVSINNNSSQAFTINTDLLSTGTGTRTLTLGGTGAGLSTFAGKISNGNLTSLSLAKSGTGTWTLSGSNSYNGTTGVSAGTLIMSGNTTTSGQITVSGNSGATLTLSGDNSGMSGGVLLNTATGTAANAPLLNINSATALGTGILSFGGGAATDVVRIDNTSLVAVNVSTANAITMNRNFTFVGTRDLSLGTGAITLGGMNANTARNITVTANTLTLAGAIADGTNGLSGITKAGAGTLVLSGATNTYTGLTTVSVGTLIAGNNAPSGLAGAFGNATSEISLGVAGGNSDASLLIGGAFNVGRNIRTATSDTTDAGTRVLTLGGNTAHNSEFSGNIILGTASQAGRGVTLTAANGGQVTFSGLIQDPGSMDATAYTVTKAGLGTVVMSNAANAYTGATSVSEGTLLVNGNVSSSVITVAAGATLGGSGTIGVATTISGILSPGNSIGTLTATGDVTWNANNAWVYELGLSAADLTLANTTGTRDLLDITGAGSDFLKGTGTSFAFDFSSTGTEGYYKLVDWTDTSTFGDSDFTATNLASGLTGTFIVDSSTSALYLNVVIPEPSTALLGGLGLLALLRRRR